MPERLCKKCNTVKSLSDFNRDKHTVSGYAWACRECRKAMNREYAKTRAKLNYGAIYSERNPDKVRAHRAVHNALKTGRMAPASACVCADCYKSPATDLHHHSYEKEHWLDVIPLCRSCHHIRHNQPDLFQ